MSALENLTAAVNRNTVAVDKVIEAWNKPNPTEEQVQAAADAINTQAERRRSWWLRPPRRDPVTRTSDSAGEAVVVIWTGLGPDPPRDRWSP
ncbi:MAG: hypothetical protein IPK15_24265 [Verrucomicrobia bacterium]|nr:hypothetical protein [Verrucomicrobiota bacterium]